MSDLHRYGFAYGHPRVPLPPTKEDDPARAAFFDHLAALRRQGQRYTPASKSEPTNTAPRNEVSAGPSADWSAAPICKICGAPVPANRLTLCSPECATEANKRRMEKWHHRAMKAAIAANEPLRPCKVCGGPIPLVEHGRKVRTDTMTCGPMCRRSEVNRLRRERNARKAGK